ncbi:hypothetical protein C5C29_07510 [Rathayibacter sp. AY1H2]|jgi:hypothetical protein|nr:hypothetical protein C5C29_07510 [Rathayibacter sp. AY1H2]
MGVQAAQYLLDTAAITPAASYNSDEFFFRAPASVGPGALVVVLSGTGETPETVRAGEWAQERGAAVVGVTLKQEGPLTLALDTAFVAQTGQGTQLVLQLLALTVLRRDGVDVTDRLEALRALPSAMVAGAGPEATRPASADPTPHHATRRRLSPRASPRAHQPSGPALPASYSSSGASPAAQAESTGVMMRQHCSATSPGTESRVSPCRIPARTCA